MQTIHSFHRTLIYEITGELFKCGSENLLHYETHTDRMSALSNIQNLLLNDHTRGWRIHNIIYAYRESRAEWLFYASKHSEPNPYIQRSINQWLHHRRARNLHIEILQGN